MNSDSTQSPNNHHSDTNGNPTRTTGGNFNHRQTHVQTNSDSVEAPQTPIDKILGDACIEAMVLASPKATDLPLDLKTIHRAKSAIYNLLAKEAVEPLYIPNYDGTFNVVEAVPLDKIKEILK